MAMLLTFISTVCLCHRRRRCRGYIVVVVVAHWLHCLLWKQTPQSELLLSCMLRICVFVCMHWTSARIRGPFVDSNNSHCIRFLLCLHFVICWFIFVIIPRGTWRWRCPVWFVLRVEQIFCLATIVKRLVQHLIMGSMKTISRVCLPIRPRAIFHVWCTLDWTEYVIWIS